MVGKGRASLRDIARLSRDLLARQPCAWFSATGVAPSSRATPSRFHLYPRSSRDVASRDLRQRRPAEVPHCWRVRGLVKLRPANADTRLDPSYFFPSDKEEDAGTVDDTNDVGRFNEENESDMSARP